MDTFKLLARSTNLNSAASSSKRRSIKLPSTGEAPDPQLFYDEALQSSEPQYKSKKRKRDDAIIPAASAAELDFFTPGSFGDDSASQTKLSDATKQSHRDEPNQCNLNDAGVDEKRSLLGLDDRKRILQGHRIKITSLSDESALINLTGKQRQEKKARNKDELPSKKKLKELRRIYPEPLVNFGQLRTRYKISRRLYENIQNEGFSVPTEIQLGSLPLLLARRQAGDINASNQGSDLPSGISTIDLLSIAPTGSGKTLSFLIPLINDLVASRRSSAKAEEKTLSALIIVPTKELANQIVNDARKLIIGTGVRITAMRKGLHVVDADGYQQDQESSDELAEAKESHVALKSDILVSTPLSLVNALSSNKSDVLRKLPSIRHLILDEADVILDPLFRDQTLGLWSACTNPGLRVSLWSATMGSNIEDLAKSTIQQRRIDLSIQHEAPIYRIVVGLKDSAIPNVKHRLVYAATEQGKLMGLRQLLHPSSSDVGRDDHLRPPFLVFTQTIPRAVALHSELLYDIPTEAGGSSRIAALHSDISDNQRSHIMARFRKGEIWVMITTDLLSRGVDFRGINGVVNYDIPNSSAAYVHRVGRTGRAGREGGVAVTYYTKEDIPYVKNIANVIAASEKSSGKEGKNEVQKWLLDALPNVNKKERRELKLKGVAARRRQPQDKDRKGNTNTRISTKSGYDRRLENARKASVRNSRRQKHENEPSAQQDSDEWEGLED